MLNADGRVSRGIVMLQDGSGCYPQVADTPSVPHCPSIDVLIAPRINRGLALRPGTFPEMLAWIRGGVQKLSCYR